MDGHGRASDAAGCLPRHGEGESVARLGTLGHHHLQAVRKARLRRQIALLETSRREPAVCVSR